MIKRCLILIFVGVLAGCELASHTHNTIWKYSSGYYVGDLIDFSLNKRFRLDDNYNLFIKDSLVGELIDIDKEKIVIESDNGERGIYYFLMDRKK